MKNNVTEFNKNKQRRPCFWFAVFLSAGIIAGEVYILQNYILLFLILIFIIYVIYYFKFSYLYLIVFLILVLTGFGWIYLGDYRYNHHKAIVNWNDLKVNTIIGEIKKNLGDLEGENILFKPYQIKNKYRHNNKISYGLILLKKSELKFPVSNGDIIKFKLKLESPLKGEANEFCYYTYLKRKNIYSLGYLKSKGEKLGQKNYFLKNHLLNLKQKILTMIEKYIDYPRSEIIKAVLLGERENFPEKLENSYNKAGINHLLAISGLHVGFIVLILMSLASILKIKTGIRNIFITLFMIFYMNITGGNASVLRAGTISILFIWAPFFNREGDIFNILGISLIINLMINPYSLFTAGLQLSYTVLLMIILWTEIIEKYLHKIVAVSISAQLGSMPVIMYYFNNITPAGIISNLWAIPLMSLIVLLSFIGIIMGFLNSLFFLLPGKIIDQLLKVFNFGTNLMSQLPGGYIELHRPDLSLIIIFLACLFYLPFILEENILINKKKRKIKLILIIFIMLLVMLLYF